MEKEFKEIYYDLADSRFIFSLLRSFHKETGMVIAFVDLSGAGSDLIFPEKVFKPNPFCQTVWSSSIRGANCKNESMETGEKRAKANLLRPLAYTCHAGLTDVVAPVFIKNTHFANLVAGQIRTSKNSEKNFKNYLELFSKSEKQKLVKLYLSTKVVSKTELKKIIDLMSFMGSNITEYGESHLFDRQPAAPDMIRKVRSFVHKHYDDPALTLEKIAKEVGLTPAYLCTLYKKEKGNTLISYILHIRVRFAKYLLSKTDKSIKTICFSCGFNTLQHFYRVFKQAEKITPSEFRASFKTQKP